MNYTFQKSMNRIIEVSTRFLKFLFFVSQVLFTFCTLLLCHHVCDWFISLNDFIIQPAEKYPDIFSEDSLFGR